MRFWEFRAISARGWRSAHSVVSAVPRLFMTIRITIGTARNATVRLSGRCRAGATADESGISYSGRHDGRNQGVGADAGSHAGCPAHAPALLRAGRAAVLRQGDRHRHGDGARAHHLRRVGRAHPPAGRRARRPRDQRAGEGGHLRLEHGPAPRALLRRSLHRAGAAHAEHPPVPRAARLHRQPRRGRDHLRRPLAPRAALAARRPARDGAPLRGDGRRQGRRAQPRRRPADPRLRGPPRRRRSRRLRRRGRTARRIDVLHERHHGEPEGRRVQPPVHLPAHARRRW